MVFFPPILWTMLRLPNLALAVSFLLYLAARSGLCDGILVFQSVLLEISLHIRGWFVLGGSIEARPLIRSRALLWLGSAYLLFAFVMTVAGRFSELARIMPTWLYDAFNPNDKTQPRALPPRPFHRSCLLHQQVPAED